MDKKEAFEILQLRADATPDEIDKRMNILYRKFRQIERDEYGYTLSDIDNAYKIASGKVYYDAEAEQDKKYRQEHPNPILKLLKLDEEKARTFFYYHKWHLLMGLILIIAVVSAIVSFTQRVEPNLRVLVVGNFYMSDTTPMEESIESEVKGVDEVLVQNIFLGSEDPQLQMAMQTKYIVELTAGENDIFLLDEEHYFELAKQGAFMPVEEVIGDFELIDLSKHEDLTVKIELDDGNEYQPTLYGIDVTNSVVLEEAGLTDERIIAAFPHSATEIENAVEFVKIMVE